MQNTKQVKMSLKQRCIPLKSSLSSVFRRVTLLSKGINDWLYIVFWYEHAIQLINRINLNIGIRLLQSVFYNFQCSLVCVP
ncbi:hypothetical protein XU18_0330 [Perkinsela sp. CCAP 1560/4]|nr:hypothetical protein XU18_0330 [Perkinsela sp. CCAP 1560/4]|eukprot:KNH09645.1 hypothetical protein XU18_0330 [Perkinsela sp. CCAP 1560/4]